MSRGVALAVDIDGTLVQGTSAGFIAKALGRSHLIEGLEEKYELGLISNDEVCEYDALVWSGMSLTAIDDVLSNLPFVDGITELVGWCRNARVEPHLASVAWEPVAQFIARRFGFVRFAGPQLEVRNGRYTGVIARPFDELQKRDELLQRFRRHGIRAKASAAIGDGRSDLPVFEAVGYSVAFNAATQVELYASTSVRSSSIASTIQLLDIWMETVNEGL